VIAPKPTTKSPAAADEAAEKKLAKKKKKQVEAEKKEEAKKKKVRTVYQEPCKLATSRYCSCGRTAETSPVAPPVCRHLCAGGSQERGAGQERGRRKGCCRCSCYTGA
jgi:hypothetical protein